MKKIKFLIKLKEKGQFEIIEPSENISNSYLQKSESHFESARILLKSKKLEESVAMAYYGMYHCLLALLFKCGIKCENHTASIILLRELFEENELAEEIKFGKEERIDKQYYTDFILTESDCKDMMRRTESFIIECKKIIKSLNEEKIRDLREELEKYLK